MPSSNKKSVRSFLKYTAAGVLSFGLVHVTNVVKAQGPPPPPPPPSEVLKKAGDGLKKINPFKKNKKTTRKRTQRGLPAPGTPPPPPANPLNLKRPATPPAPPKPPGI